MKSMNVNKMDWAFMKITILMPKIYYACFNLTRREMTIQCMCAVLLSCQEIINTNRFLSCRLDSTKALSEPILVFRFVSLASGQLYDCHRAPEVILKRIWVKLVSIEPHQNKSKCTLCVYFLGWHWPAIQWAGPELGDVKAWCMRHVDDERIR